MTHSSNPAQRLGDFAIPNHAPNDHPKNGPEILRVIAVGSAKAVNHHIHVQHHLGYAEPNEWSRPLPTVNPNEVMRILTKRLVGLDG